jgi:phage/plasmid-associated DNA primase
LNLCLAAYARATKHGFTQPASSADAVKSWKLETDPVAHFVDDQCTRDFSGEETFADVYRRYKGWAPENSVGRLLSKKAFSERLSRMGLGTTKTRDGVKVPGIWLRVGVD